MSDSMKADNHQNKHSTVFQLQNRKLNVGLDKQDFEKSSLMRLAD